MEEEKNNSLKESRGSGFLSTLIFMAGGAVAIAVMIVLRHYLNY